MFTTDIDDFLTFARTEQSKISALKELRSDRISNKSRYESLKRIEILRELKDAHLSAQDIDLIL